MGRIGVALALAAVAACGGSSGSGGGGPDAMTDAAMPTDGTMPDAKDGGGSDAADAGDGDAASIVDATTPDAADGAVGDAAAEAAEDAAEDAPFEAGEAGPPSLCPGTFLFCDGFEQNLTNWTGISTTGGGAAVDSVHVYRGAKALHVTIDPVVEAGTTSYAAVQKYGAQPWPTHFFTRFFSYVPAPSPPSTAGLLDLIQNGAPYSGTELRITPPSAGLEMQTYGTSAGIVNWDSADASSPLDQWVCFEVEIDTVAETAHVYMNDTEVTDLTRSGLTLPQLGNTSVGLTFFQANVQGQTEAWIDEVAVNSARIGCAN
ncbi:MAG TPA: hypothetical protein VF765_08605 [Polyangiaceae bacterium]